MEASSSEQQFCLRWNNHKSNLLSEFNELLQSEAFTDVTLVVEDGPSFIKCHKMVLAACSTYFQALFIHLPSNEQHPVIVLKDVRYSEMKAILEYMYQGEVSIAQNQLSELLKVANLLRVKGLVEDKPTSTPPLLPMPRRDSASPPPAISTSTERNPAYNENTNGHVSPPHSTSSSPYYSQFVKSPTNGTPNVPQMTPPVWNHFSSLSLAVQSAVSTPLGTSRGTSIFPGMYETEKGSMRKKMANLMVNHDTPILRTVLGQGHADSSQAVPLLHSDSHELYRSSSNGSANDANDSHRNSMDLSYGSGVRSPYPPDVSFDDDEKKFSQQMQSRQKHKEWKRYKQYTKEDMDSAIQAVKFQKMTALKAASKYGIPSRTLYDKVKKMGIVTPRNGRRHLSTSGAHFPHGIGCNRNGSIYGNAADHDADIDHSMAESTSALLQLGYGGMHDAAVKRELIADSGRSLSPDEELQQAEEQDEDHVQDLSVNRKNVIVPPTNPPKTEEEEKDDQN